MPVCFTPRSILRLITPIAKLEAVAIASLGVGKTADGLQAIRWWQEGNLREIEEEKVLPREPSFYVQNPIVTDSSLAPPGKSGLYILVPVPHLSPSTPWDAATRANPR
jgi:phytoene dehydrogenase-like protein